MADKATAYGDSKPVSSSLFTVALGLVFIMRLEFQSDTSFRRTWDKEEYTKRAREKVRRVWVSGDFVRQRLKSICEPRIARSASECKRRRSTCAKVCATRLNDEFESSHRGKSIGKKPPRRKEELPKPTEFSKQREAPLELDKNARAI